MKKLITIAALGATLTTQTFAGDREWATVGKVLTGVAVIHVIDRIVNPPTQVVYVQPQPVVYAQPVVVQPVPVVYGVLSLVHLLLDLSLGGVPVLGADVPFVTKLNSYTVVEFVLVN